MNQKTLKNLKPRLITGLAFGFGVITLVYLNAFTFATLFLFFLVAGIWELFSLFENQSKPRIKIFSIILGITLFSMCFLHASSNFDPRYFAFLMPAFFLLFYFNLYTHSTQKHFAPFVNLIGVLYVALPFSLLNYLVFSSSGEYEPLNLLGVILLIWTNDSFAYFTGSMIGKNKLFERISPGKTWEGFIGGFLFCLGMGVLIGMYLGNVPKWMLFAVIMSVFGTIGDLVESHMKRLAGIKDSGKILPGHGGVLDRFDALIFATPFIFVVDLFL